MLIPYPKQIAHGAVKTPCDGRGATVKNHTS